MVRHTHTHTFCCKSKPTRDKREAQNIFLSSNPQKDFFFLFTKKDTRKRENHATKVPSSFGLFVEDSSCFFVSGPRVKKKRGRGREKRKFKKDYSGKKRERLRDGKT